MRFRSVQKTRDGFERLAKSVSDALSRPFLDVDIMMSVSNGKLLAYLAAHGEILSTKYDESNVKVHCRIPQKVLGKISDDPTIEITKHGQTTESPDATSPAETNSPHPNHHDFVNGSAEPSNGASVSPVGHQVERPTLDNDLT